MSEATQQNEAWRNVAPVPRSVAEDLTRSRRELGQFLTARFTEAFGVHVEEVMFETFPDGLYATMYVAGRRATEHNVWAALVSSALRDAGVEVSVVVLPSSDRLE